MAPNDAADHHRLDLSKTYASDFQALKGVDLEIRRGEIFAILSGLVRDRGKTVVAVTHNVDLASRMDRRIHLVDGAVTSDERTGG
ncbi:hypothetical protein KXS07_29405 [Inquilinus limosus]|uniref:hypothetical protein n=1 Tax=Inquilinus limosus TaxID=171674 RepID=UPI003F14D1CF